MTRRAQAVGRANRLMAMPPRVRAAWSGHPDSDLAGS